MKKLLALLAAFSLAITLLPSAIYAQDSLYDRQSVVTENPTNVYGKENFHIYLFIGQSNMSGRADIEETDEHIIDRTYLFNSTENENGVWEKAQPLFNSETQMMDGLNRYSTVMDSSKQQGLNPAFYCAETLTQNIPDDVAVGIVGNARGDTSINQWQKGYEETSGKADYDLYEQALAQAQKAMQYGTIKGIIWHHGEANANSTGYISKFKSMVENFRTDLGIADLPVIVGEIGGFGKDQEQIDYRRSFNGSYISKLPENVSNCYYVSSVGLVDVGDLTHFNSFSQRELGRRYASMALKKIYGIGDESSPIINSGKITANDGSINAFTAHDGNTSFYSYKEDADTTAYDNSYWKASDTWQTGRWEIDFGKDCVIDEINSYFFRPWNYAYKYKIFAKTSADSSFTLIKDSSTSGIYTNVGDDGGLVDKFDNLCAKAIRIEIVDVRDYKGNNMRDAEGGDIRVPAAAHEFVFRGQGTKTPVWSENFNGYANDYTLSSSGYVDGAKKIVYTKKTTDGTISISAGKDGTNALKFDKPTAGAKDNLQFNYNSYIADLDVYTLEFDVKTTCNNNSAITFQEGASESAGAVFQVQKQTYTTMKYLGTPNQSISSSGENWHTMTVVVRRNDALYDFYLDGVAIDCNCTAKGTKGDDGYLRFFMSTNSSATYEIDNIAVYEGAPECYSVTVAQDNKYICKKYTDGTVTVNVVLSDMGIKKEMNATLVSAVYGNDGKLNSVKTAVVSPEQTKNSAELTVDDASNTNMKIMLWDGVNSMKPIDFNLLQLAGE